MDPFVILIVLNCLVTLYQCLRKFWWGVEDGQRNASRNRRRRRDGLSTSEATACKGLDQAILESLPVVHFCSEEFRDGLECSVCLSEVVDGEKTRFLPNCNHGFHVDCIDTWFQSHSTCPLCRDTVSSSTLKSLTEVEVKVDAEAEAIVITNSATTKLMLTGSSRSSNVFFSSHDVEGYVARSSPVVGEGSSHVVIDIPMETAGAEDKYDGEAKWALVLRRMKRLKKLLSRENRVVSYHNSPSYVNC